MPRKQPSAPTASPAAPPADLFTHNQALAEVSRTLYGDNARLEVVDPRSLTLLKENARYFKKETFRQLVENVKHDRRLSSMPLCYADPATGQKVVLSGNHRVKAAIEGAVPLILVLTITEDLSRSQQIAIQLSHNALVGQDDAGILSHLWAQIEDINARLYAGLSSENMKEIEDVKLVTFSTPSVATKSLSFAFTEYERDQLDQVMEELSRIHANETYVFPAEQFQDFFQLIQNVKGKKNIKNGSMAMVKILEIVTAHLEASDESRPPAPRASRERRADMGFIGALPSEVRRIIATLAPEIRRPVINVCAGNFTIPSILRSAGYAGDIYACDVTLYTSALGAYLTDRPLDLKIRPDAPATLAELLNIDTPAGAFASIALLYDLRQVWKMKNPFQARQVESYRRNWPALVAKLKAKLAAYKEHLAGVRYDPKDGFEVLQESSPEHHIFTAPPIYKGDYEKLDKLLTLCLEWTPPAYKPMLDTDLDIYRLIARFEGYAVVIYKDLPPVYEILGQPTAVIMPRGRGSNTLRVITRGARRIVVRHQVKSEDVGPFLPASCSPTGREKVTLARITLGQSIRMNELFASARINTFTGGTAESVVFMLDGKIFGKADFCKSSHQWKFPDEEGFPPMIYLMSDLVVPNDTPRLAKLVLLCLLSSEVKQLLDIHFSEDFAYVGTTAFSAHAASMKYRGIFKMHKRMEDPNGYRLNYCCRFGGHSLQGALKSWMRKHKESK